jgi:hypothetical protein
MAGATEAEIAALPGIGPRLASSILAALDTGGLDVAGNGKQNDTGDGRGDPARRGGENGQVRDGGAS